MSWLSNAVDWVKDKAGTIAKVALPVVGFGVGLVAPGVGAAIGNLADKIGNKLSDLTGIGDGKPGILGIGDGLPGVLGIGTGKNKQEAIAAQAKATSEAVVKALAEKTAAGVALSPADEEAKKKAEADIKKETGFNPTWLIGGLLALLAL